VPAGEDHLVVQAIREGLDYVGASQVGLRLACANRIPHGRGLGSSAAAIVAGLLVARGLVADPGALDDTTVLELATAMEGHPDNAAPALLGGATVAWADGPVRATRVPVHPDVLPVAIVPPYQVPTRRARAVLPRQVSHADAAFQAGRAALLVAALGQQPDLLFPATEDRLHQEYRRAVMPESLALIGALRRRGVAAVVSGAGPSVLALARRTGGVADEGPTTDADAAISAAFGGAMAGWRVLPLPIDLTGAVAQRGVFTP
ncbi:MAG: homoserine kinase, partial [Micrococcales bacterium]|nr:homoserine kinase [Micrococcales bacterium]